MKNNSGFTLIETSILIIMISLILVPLFGYMTQIRLQEKAIAEEAEMDTILAAIAKFLKENNSFSEKLSASIQTKEPAQSTKYLYLCSK